MINALWTAGYVVAGLAVLVSVVIVVAKMFKDIKGTEVVLDDETSEQIRTLSEMMRVAQLHTGDADEARMVNICCASCKAFVLQEYARFSTGEYFCGSCWSKMVARGER